MFDVFVASLCVVSKVVCIQPVSNGQFDFSFNCFPNIGAIIIGALKFLDLRIQNIEIETNRVSES